MKTLTLGPQIVWSNGNLILFHPLMAGAASSDFAKGRFHLEVRARTANCQVRVAGQYSDDGITWTDNPVAIVTTWTSTNGVGYGTAWIDIQALFTTVRAYFRIGVECQGTVSGSNELCLVALRADIKDA